MEIKVELRKENLLKDKDRATLYCVKCNNNKFYVTDIKDGYDGVAVCTVCGGTTQIYFG
jgi:transcription elongation factor Elf1